MANIWYVSDERSDDNDCQTECTPCKNLQTVLDRASDGADLLFIVMFNILAAFMNVLR